MLYCFLTYESSGTVNDIIITIILFTIRVLALVYIYHLFNSMSFILTCDCYDIDYCVFSYKVICFSVIGTVMMISIIPISIIFIPIIIHLSILKLTTMMMIIHGHENCLKGLDCLNHQLEQQRNQSTLDMDAIRSSLNVFGS